MNRIPVVNMIRNMEPLAYTNEHNPPLEKMRNLIRAKLAGLAVRKADRTIAVSKFVRDFLGTCCNIPSRRIAVIYHGVNQPHRIKATKPKYIPESWSGRFLFTAGSIRPARGLEDIIMALKYLLPKERHLIGGVVIAGNTDPVMSRYRQKLEKKMVRNRINRHVVFAGYLSEQEMTWCYKNCLVFVMTSRVEACPNIALAAMSNGCVCISADSPPLPEIFAEAALYYPSKNGKALAESIRNVPSWDNPTSHQLSQKARRRAGEFSWDITAKKTVEQLKKAIEDSKYAEIENK
jgi:glycosyltransferase involved in cell wall biosynthesis